MSAMTASATDRDIHTAPALPRVNLLPPEIVEGRQFRRVQSYLTGAVVAALLLVVLLYVLAAGAVGHAQRTQDAATAEQARVQTATSAYKGVTDTASRVQLVHAMLGQAMGKEVRYSQILSALATSMPDNVWLTNAVYADAAASTGNAATSGSVAASGTPTGTAASVGTVTMSGVAYSQDDVSTWLEALAQQHIYSTPVLQSSVAAVINGRAVVNWSVTTSLTSAAESHRYTTAGS